VTLDEFALDPAVVKIDVEGHVMAVLGGARKTLARAHPVLYIETGDEHEAIEALLAEFGYKHFGALETATPVHVFQAER
jgi:hypothetical protein